MGGEVRLVAEAPELRVLYLSGYSEGLPPDLVGTRLLAKPFGADELLAVVSELGSRLRPA